MLKTPLCQQLGIEYPLFSAGLGGGMAGPELVAAVSNAGACGVLGMGGLPAPYIRQQIHQLRTLTNKPFGVNILLPLLQEGQIETCLDEQVPFLVLFWGDSTPYIAAAHRRGTKVFVQVGSVEEAQAAVAAGVDAIIAQGIEAGGHVKSTTALSTIVPAVVEAVKPVPVIAAGGIANGRGWWPHSVSGRRPFPWAPAFSPVRRRVPSKPTRNGWCRAGRKTPSIPCSSTWAGLTPPTGCSATE